jgi:hypothetical protein
MNDEQWAMNGEQRVMHRREEVAFPVLEGIVCCQDLVLDVDRITEAEFVGYLREGEKLGAQLIPFGRKVLRQGIRLKTSLLIVHCSS